MRYQNLTFLCLDNACSPTIQDNSNFPMSFDGPTLHITPLHDSVSSVTANIYQNYGLAQSNLVPITEEDEKSSINYPPNDLEETTEFKRGGVARSTKRASKKRNFKALKLDMSICKNNLQPDTKHGLISNEDNNLDGNNQIKTIQLVKTPDSPLQNMNVDDGDMKESCPSKISPLSIQTESPNLSEVQPRPNSRNLSSSPKVSMNPDLSISDGEDIFDDLSSEILGTMSEDEEMFDKISMNLDIEHADADFEVTLSESMESSRKQNIQTAANDKAEDLMQEEIQHFEEKPQHEDESVIKAELTPEPELVLRRTSLRHDIDYWEKRASDSAESRVLKININTDSFKRGSLQRSTIKKSKKKVCSPRMFDANLGSHNSNAEKCVAAAMLSAKNDLLELTSADSSVPCFDDKNDCGSESESGRGCIQPQSIKPIPAPRKKTLPVQRRKVGASLTKVLVRNDTNDYLPKLDPSIKAFQLHPTILFNIRTWEQRRKEKHRIIPTKRLVEWF